VQILFLDIDGVLNRDSTKERCFVYEGGPHRYMGVDRELAKLLTSWLDTTKIKTVLSSTWRQHRQMWDHLHEAGIHWIDTTPVLGNRGIEIEAWLSEHPGVQYAILDDSNAFMAHQRPRIVQTNVHEGLTLKHINQLDKLMN
jgi:hypothetical protein